MPAVVWHPSASDTLCVASGGMFLLAGSFMAGGIPGLMAAVGLLLFLFGIATDLRRAALQSEKTT